jgi:hemerythrin-like domain-containing protein
MSALRKAYKPQPNILSRLIEDHQHLAQVLEVFEHQYRALETDEGPDYELLRDILDYVQSFPDTLHHPTEDALFDYLLRNGSLSADEETVIGVNRAQHQELIEATQELLRMIDHVFNDGIVVGAALKLTMSRYLSEQLRHMEFESSCLFPLAETRLSKRDWDELENQVRQTKDPLFDAFDEQYEILRRYIEEQHKPVAWA